ncbi:hypothetical protein [Kangiella geojedonensis]|uniref:Lipoprotein n=1 Tax=Kangiella geojedonensis TaxID=914150 RepID=A0A0F6RD51_9GAMM|nr:hypothetical protein [Kangiella geojedonensis]AKE52616.1 hypothetical protein TQ33_1674 [Kangiella geojedonensis]
MRIIVLSILLAIFLSACNTSRPLTNLNNHNIEYLVDEDETLNDIRLSILRAGQVLGWETDTVKPGLIRATLHLRAHTAVVDIPYSLTDYSIIYVDSNNLDYDGQNIHRSYPRWVNNLKAKIDEYIASR